MAWSFRKRIKIIPGVHLNLSKSGISTSIGVKGANINFGKAGTYLNTSIPFLGLHQRQKLSGGGPSSRPESIDTYVPPNALDNIFSADIHEITSQNMQGVKEAILLANQQRNELKSDLLKIQTVLGSSKLQLALSYAFLYGLVKKQIPRDIKTNIATQKEAIHQTRAQIDSCYVQLDIDFDPEVKAKYDLLVEAFKKLITSHNIWDVTSSHYQDRAVTRSSFSTVVSKRNVRFEFKSITDIKSEYPALYFQNANGADLYFYPGFIVMYSNKTDFAIIGFDELIFNHSYVRFTETGTVPHDSKIIDRTWVKVNKNGTPDRRFKGNYQIPVVRYGEINLRTHTGLNEEYEFSNYEFTQEFGNAFKAYQSMIQSLKKL